MSLAAFFRYETVAVSGLCVLCRIRSVDLQGITRHHASDASPQTHTPQGPMCRAAGGARAERILGTSITY